MQATHIMVVMSECVVNIYLRHATEDMLKNCGKEYDVRVESAS